MGRVIRQTTRLGEKLKAALDVDKYSSRVGWFEGAKYEDGTPVAYVAAIQEFGSAKNNIPPRSFMRSTSVEREREWAELAKSGAKAALAGTATPRDVMDGLGQQAKGDISKKIIQIQDPPLKDGTVKGRLRKLANGKKVGNLTKPLVESGYMLNSLSSMVEES